MTSVIMFVPQYKEGSEFVSEISKLFSDVSKYEFEIVYVKKVVNPLQQQQMLFAIHVADVVIVDCTIPIDNTDGGVYPALSAQINCLNHIVVVSENVLPLNIKPYRCIAPKEDGKTLSYTNIIKRLPEVVSQSIQEDTYDRFPAEEFLSDMEKFMPNMEKMIQASLSARSQKKASPTTVMISYRNSHKMEVDDFVQIIEGNDTKSINLRKVIGCDGNYQIKVLPPASLCGEYEAHTPMRRWMLVGILEDHIREVDEVWVYESRDVHGNIDYTNSWWTIAEMLMVAYVNKHSTKKINIRVYNPILKKFYDTTPEKYMIELSNNQNQRLARLLSNTRPDTMGPEARNRESGNSIFQQVQFVEKYQNASWLEKKIMKRALRNNLERVVPKFMGDEERKEMLEEMVRMYTSPEEVEKYINDDVFKDEFWNNISYQTTTCTPCFHDDKIDVDSFLQIPMLELTDLEIKDFEKATYAKDNVISIRGNNYNVSKAPTNRYLWVATRMEKPTIGERSKTPGLEVIPIYNISNIDK